MLADQVRTRAKQYFDQVPPSHDWYHVERVTRLAVDLADFENANTRVIEISALLHDIGRAREDRGDINNHAEWGAREAGQILAEFDLDDTFKEAVQHCIRSHRYSTSPAPETLEAKVLSDADNLDALGAVGIARTFAHSGEENRVLADPDNLPEEDTTSAGRTGLNHLAKKILSLKERMYTNTARLLASKRQEIVADFVNQMRSEITGESFRDETH
ncbi:MAG: HD domain-containing protein [bacterium]